MYGSMCSGLGTRGGGPGRPPGWSGRERAAFL